MHGPMNVNVLQKHNK